MSKVTSKDGTAIAYERTGSGPALILVDGALCSRAFGPMPKLAPLLAEHFTVLMYDRRGRGGSGDTRPYAREREVEDIAALIEAAGGGPVNLLGLSSGAALALEAAASGLDIGKVAAYEPPYVSDGGPNAASDHEGQLRRLIAEDRRGEAVTYFMRKMVGVPAIFVLMMRLMPGVWRKLKAVAHTLPYDAQIMNRFTVPKDRFASIRVPVLVIGGAKSEARLQSAVRAVAAAVPGAGQRLLAGQTHNVDPKVLAPAVVAFFAGGPADLAAERGLAAAR
jgi:pimeloyl-ACP methyl ester carboxylesterase